MICLIRRFHKQRRSGTAVIEFALIAPFLMMLLLGVCDLAPSLMVKFKVGTATQALADLAAQSAIVQVNDLPNLFSIGGDIMAPFAAAPLIQRISNIASDGNRTFVYWSCGEGLLGPLQAFQNTTAPTGIIATNKADTSYIIVESQYSYTAPAGFIIKTPQLMAVTAYTLPRVSTFIGPSPGIPGYTPTKPSASKNSNSVTVGGGACNYVN